jgi:hypothetical protein
VFIGYGRKFEGALNPILFRKEERLIEAKLSRSNCAVVRYAKSKLISEKGGIMSKRLKILSYLIIVLAAFLTVSLKGFAEEIYVSTTIVKANWGNALNEFSVPDVPILTGKAGKELGPKYFVINDKGDIFILDAVKKQILVFNTWGKYKRTMNLDMGYDLGTIEMEVDICIDSKGNIYIYPYWWRFFVDKFNKDGKLLQRFLLRAEESLYPEVKEEYLKFKKADVTYSLVPKIGNDAEYRSFHIFNDSSDNVFLSAGKKDGREIVINLSSKLEKYVWSERVKGKIRNISERFINAKKIKDDTYLIQKVDMTGLVKKELQIVLPEKYVEGKHHFFVYPGGEDRQGNIYVDILERKFNSEKQDWDEKKWTNKYDSKGNLMTKIDFLRDVPNVQGGYRSWDGEYYQIVWNLRDLNQGIKVIKWTIKK